MYSNLKLHQKLWFLIGSISSVIAIISLTNLKLYEKVADGMLMPGTISQDIQTVIAGIILSVLALKINDEGIKAQIICTGLTGYIVYAYGIYAFEQYYTFLYFFYLLILTLGTFEILHSVRTYHFQSDIMSRKLRNLNLITMVIVPLIFITLWVLALIPIIRGGTHIDHFYSIYVIDLSFIMPAMLYSAYRLYKNHMDGLILSTVFLILGATMLLPVGMGEFLKPIYALPIDIGGLIFFLVLSLVFLSVVFYSLRTILKSPEESSYENAS